VYGQKLLDLHPRWVGHGGEGITINGQPVPFRAGVGLSFDCPCGCGSHCYIPLENPLSGSTYPDARPELPKWTRSGDDFASLTLSPSIQRVGGCQSHFHIQGGTIVP
jgi:hypothetical protein